MKKRIPIERITLGVIAVAGIIPLLAVAPGLGVILKQLGIVERLQGRTYVPTILSRLKKKGYITLEGSGEQRQVRITEKGRHYLEAKRVALLYRPQKRRWDGYWRIVVFDIPEKSRRARTLLRDELREVGFKKLQASVWISPDECEEYIKLLKADRRIGKYLIYLKTRDIEYGTSLVRMFDISERS